MYVMTVLLNYVIIKLFSLDKSLFYLKRGSTFKLEVALIMVERAPDTLWELSLDIENKIR